MSEKTHPSGDVFLLSIIHLKEGTAPVATGSDRGGAYNRTCGVRRMTVVYWDRVVVLNGIVDYLLLLSAAWLSGLPLRRGRLVLWAALGGLYAGAVFLPGLEVLGVWVQGTPDQITALLDEELVRSVRNYDARIQLWT